MVSKEKLNQVHWLQDLLKLVCIYQYSLWYHDHPSIYNRLNPERREIHSKGLPLLPHIWAISAKLLALLSKYIWNPTASHHPPSQHQPSWWPPVSPFLPLSSFNLCQILPRLCSKPSHVIQSKSPYPCNVPPGPPWPDNPPPPSSHLLLLLPSSQGSHWWASAMINCSRLRAVALADPSAWDNIK